MRSITAWIISLALALSLAAGGAAAGQSASGGDASISISKKAKKKKAKRKRAKKAARKKAAKKRAKKRRKAAKRHAKRRAERRKKPRPKVVILSADQSALTGEGVKVRVAANKKMRVKVKVKSTSFDEGETTISARKVVRFNRKKKRVVTMPLTDAAKTAASTCASRTIAATGKTKGNVSTSSADMERTLPACALPPVNLSKPECDFIAQPKEGLCMLPFPNDYYTKADASSPTGKRINFTSGGMPKNVGGTPISPAGFKTSDGFSQGQGILLKVPGIDTAADVAANDMVPLDHLGRYEEADQRVIVIDADTGKRWPIWAQIDSNAGDQNKAALMISPSQNFKPKGHYIVALRNLTNGSGGALTPPSAFRYYRDDLPSDQAEVNARRDHYEGLFDTLKGAGVKRSELYLTWDFTVASDENNYERALSMRDDAFADIGATTMGDKVVQGDAPAFTITNPTAGGLNGNIARHIKGTYTVPCFLTNGCQPGGVFDLDANGKPTRNGDYQAKFECIVPPVGVTGPNPPKLRPMVFGHGLLGTAGQVTGSIGPNLAQDHSMISCATDEIGMASEDLPSVAGALTDLSNFAVVPDRLQQGLVNELFLARLMYHPDGLGTDTNFQYMGDSVIRTDHVYYLGASQGAIMGGPLTALSPDFTQSALVVGGMNYSNLLNRSTDWPAYGVLFEGSYPDELSQPLALNLIQMLWDRGEPNGYAHRMTDNPPPNTPKHRVNLIVAVGDHQVSNFTSDIEARTAGFVTNAGGINDQRWPNYDDLWNVPRLKPGDYPYTGSTIAYYDTGPFRTNPADLGGDNIGTGTPPIPNLAPTSLWEDPHGAPRGAAGPVEMINTFFDPNGYINDLCGGEACIGSGWDGDFNAVIPPH
ncbi:MAG: hypothetical protein IPK93_05215 [Solirubrobacterales bacterium]|nr:hypothetical protein [Solirubrobacterales bacterium]